MILIFYIFYKLAKKTGITHYLKRKYKALKKCIGAARHTGQAEADVEAQADNDSLPGRLINPGEYHPVLSTMKEQSVPSLQKTRSQSRKNWEGWFLHTLTVPLTNYWRWYISDSWQKFVNCHVMKVVFLWFAFLCTYACSYTHSLWWQLFVCVHIYTR